MVINDKVVFIPIPKNASWSVENSCVFYGFDLKFPNTLWENSIKSNVGMLNKRNHIHSKLHTLIESFGSDFEFVSILRDSTDRFISAWRFFIAGMCELHPDEETISHLKSIDNSFIIDFIKRNYSDYTNIYSSKDIRKSFFEKLLTDLGFKQKYFTNDVFNERFSIHTFGLSSQYVWIINDTVKVKTFNFDKLDEFESYMSNKFDVDFKLMHVNKNSITGCNVKRTPEMIEFVDKYVDGSIKKTPSII